MHWGLATLAGGWTKQLHNNNVHVGHVFLECAEHAFGIGHSCWGTDQALPQAIVHIVCALPEVDQKIYIGGEPCRLGN